MLVQLAAAGPTTVGIFRRGPNVRAVREVRAALDQGTAGDQGGPDTVHWAEISVFVTAALLKVGAAIQI